MRATRLVVLLAAAAAAAPAPAKADARTADEPAVIAVLRAFDRIGEQKLWPGFEPRTIAVEVYDGASTYLYRHPRPPAGFLPVPALPGLFASKGRHETVRANTGTEVDGIPTATADLSRTWRSPEEQAALLIHETFHVFAKRAHPDWAANEAALFLYPLDDAGLLALRRLETRALVRALRTANGPDAACAAKAALAIRERRAAQMPKESIAYERGTERNEGLAQYVERFSIGQAPALGDDDFPAAEIRQRGYATGQAWAVLLDRHAPGWKAQLDRPLDEALRGALANATCPDESPSAVDETARAQRDVADLVKSRAIRQSEFENAPGWRLEIVAEKAPLGLQTFDPLNVVNLGALQVLHTRWLKLANAGGSLEVLNHACLTEGVGPHPLFDGAKRVTVTGLAEPKVSEKDGTVEIEVDGVKARLAGTIERGANRIVIRAR